MSVLTQAGDTIVEVLIAIAIISLVLVGAYVSTNQNIARTQDAQERSQAVKLAETQIEFIRSSGTNTLGGHCLAKATGDTSAGLQTAGGQPGQDKCIVDGSDTQASALMEPRYTLSITNPGGVYLVNVSWDTATGSGRNNVSMYYAQP